MRRTQASFIPMYLQNIISKIHIRKSHVLSSLCLLLSFVLMSAIHAGSVAYTYDYLGRVTKATYSNGKVISYSYDTAGNRTSVVTTG